MSWCLSLPKNTTSCKAWRFFAKAARHGNSSGTDNEFLNLQRYSSATRIHTGGVSRVDKLRRMLDFASRSKGRRSQRSRKGQRWLLWRCHSYLIPLLSIRFYHTLENERISIKICHGVKFCDDSCMYVQAPWTIRRDLSTFHVWHFVTRWRISTFLFLSYSDIPKILEQIG